jgi:putative FmdB family regulatory protein
VPLYEYQCCDCGHQFELLVRVAMTPACPSCHSEHLQRLLSAFAVSSESLRQASIQSARRTVAKSADRRDRQRAQAEDTLEHLREDYGVATDTAKLKS